MMVLLLSPEDGDSMFLQNGGILVGFEVLMATSMKLAVFWVVVPCNLVEVYRRFSGSFCLHQRGDVSRMMVGAST
jgi:hypothetical protein